MRPLFFAARLFNEEPVAAICNCCGDVLCENLTYIDQVVIFHEQAIGIWPAGAKQPVVHECKAGVPFTGRDDVLQFRTQAELDAMRRSVIDL